MASSSATPSSSPSFLARFFQAEASSGIVLLLAAALALLWANSPAAGLYRAWNALPVLPFAVHGGAFTWQLFVNDALMAVFFLFAGLEIKRELTEGELSTRQKAVLPLAGALGGMVFPALIFTALNLGGPGAHGWGVPMATDIAFALGAMQLLGKRVPPGLKVFLVALAIVDDLGAIAVIALFYSGHLAMPWLLAAAAILAVLALLNRRGVVRLAPYLLGGAALWVAVFQSGLHATLAGVALAFCLPGPVRGPEAAETPETAKLSPREALITKLHPWVSFGILPLFALANAGIALSPTVTGMLAEPLGLGIIGGLVLGKPLGITLFSAVAVALGLAALPDRTRWGQLAGAGLLGGIGFTMSIFIASLAFSSEAMLDGAKLAVFAASILAGVGGYLALRLQGKASG